LGDGDPTCGPLPEATGRGFAGFFVPLLKRVLGMGGNPGLFRLFVLETVKAGVTLDKAKARNDDRSRQWALTGSTQKTTFGISRSSQAE
jgi:hypothetical protein